MQDKHGFWSLCRYKRDQFWFLLRCFFASLRNILHKNLQCFPKSLKYNFKMHHSSNKKFCAKIITGQKGIFFYNFWNAQGSTSVRTLLWNFDRKLQVESLNPFFQIGRFFFLAVFTLQILCAVLISPSSVNLLSKTLIFSVSAVIRGWRLSFFFFFGWEHSKS